MCHKHNIPELIFVSSDKACNPTTMYGYSKAVGEKTVLKNNYMVVRLGNIAYSTNSVLDKWSKNKSITVHRVDGQDIYRYFIMPQKAVHMCLMPYKPRTMIVPKMYEFNITKLAKLITELDKSITLSFRNVYIEKQREVIMTDIERAQAVDMGEYYEIPHN